MDVEGEEVGGWARQNHAGLFDGRRGRRQRPRSRIMVTEEKNGTINGT